MRSLISVMLLMLFCSVQMTSSTVVRIGVAQAVCCVGFTDVRIPVKQVVSFYWTSRSCSRRAIVFKTKAGKEICVDADTPWVKGLVDKVDKRTTV